MRFDVMTLFPAMIENYCEESIIGRGIKAGHLQVYAHNIRDYSKDKHRRVDDTPYGGGMGMLMSAVPVCDCYDAVKALAPKQRTRTIYLSPKGRVLTQKKAMELAGYERLILLCGHYEGIDSRAIEEICDEELSVGDYVLTGGELGALIVIDAVGRLVDGVLADESCYTEESIAAGMLEYPQYTRPEEFRGKRVPEVLLSGNHKEIEKWRYRAALEETMRKRPDLL
ncbi:MAG: tRNA (guanosine(37)-N1)-methyltransferase TrmD [Clostridia bacterium]|nr:tRNA (guanosine(37)-N1)-methyltransferase TrmD [Clostridia bacterium]